MRAKYEGEENVMDFKQLATVIEPSNDNPAAESHPFSVPDLRLYAYAEKYGEPISAALTEHLAHCTLCEDWLKILHRTDSVLIGEDEERVKQLIREAGGTEEEVPVPSLLAHTATVGAATSRAMNIFRRIIGKVA
jgi:hypothetical protein